MNKEDIVFTAMLLGALLWAAIIGYFIYKEFKHPKKGSKNNGSGPHSDFSGYSDNFS